MDGKKEALAGSTESTEQAQVQTKGTEKSTSMNPGSQPPSLLRRSSLESTASTLPPYSEQPAQPPDYSFAEPRADLTTASLQAPKHSKASRMNLTTGTGAPGPKPGNTPAPTGHNAAAVNAMLAPSNPTTDKMHSNYRKDAEYYNEDPTYRKKLADREGTTGTWNYFGSDIEQYGNPFKGLKRGRK